jgi:hypothetical protein
MHTTTAALAALVAAMTLVGCSEGSTEPEAETSPAAAASPGPEPGESEAPTGILPDEMQATWLLDVPRDQIGENLEEAGLGKLVDRFYESEDLETARVQMALTFEPDYFYVAWRLKDEVWDEGWSGLAQMEDGVLRLHDSYHTHVIDSYRPSVDRDELTLEYVESTVPELTGLPIEIFGAAYFSQPWTRVDCTREDLDACL